MSRKYKWYVITITIIQFVIYDFVITAVTDIDTSGIQALNELHRSLQKRDAQVKMDVPNNKIKFLMTRLYIYIYNVRIYWGVLLFAATVDTSKPRPVGDGQTAGIQFG